MSSRTRSFRLPDYIFDVLDVVDAKNQTQALQECLIDGLKFQMSDPDYNNKPISLRYLRRLSPEGVVEEYKKYIDAIVSDMPSRPVEGPYGNIYEFVRVEINSPFYREGVTEYLLKEIELIRQSK